MAGFEHPVTVTWADCDPAAIAYTGRVPYWALEAIEAFWRAAVGIDWYALNLDRNTGTPFVHLSLDFRAPVTPRAPLICAVSLVRLGRSSLDFQVRGRQEERLCFEGKFTCVLVAADTMRPKPPEPELRARLEQWLEPAPSREAPAP